MEIDNSQKLQVLKESIASNWKNVLHNNLAAKLINDGDFDERFYKIYLLETYFYTAHNAKNQALVGARIDNTNVQYVKYCMRHASEEVGHELMALHDLRNMGVKTPVEELPTPLPETDVLIAYLYYVSQTGNPVQRLGYSAWAEDSYEHFSFFLGKIQQKLTLSRAQMSFFVEHAAVDDKHADQVDQAILRSCKTENDWKAVNQVADTSLKLASNLLDAVAREYLKLRNNESDRYKFLG